MKLIDREQIAAMNIHYLYYSLEYFLDTQAALGVKTIELWPGAPHFFLDSMTYSDCREIRHKGRSRAWLQGHGNQFRLGVLQRRQGGSLETFCRYACKAGGRS